MKKILVIEDDTTAIKILSHTLQSIAELTIKNQIKDGRDSLHREKHDLVLLDINLPDGNGLELMENIRYEKKNMFPPIIILSGDEREATKVQAFNLGADDYIQKPYPVLEMRARVERILRTNNVNPLYITRGPLKLNIQNHTLEIFNEGQHLNEELTAKEYKILKAFMEHPKVVLDRERIIDLVWGQEVHLTDRTIDTHLSAIRKKMGKYGNSIRSIRGVGYQFEIES